MKKNVMKDKHENIIKKTIYIYDFIDNELREEIIIKEEKLIKVLFSDNVFYIFYFLIKDLLGDIENYYKDHSDIKELEEIAIDYCDHVKKISNER